MSFTTKKGTDMSDFKIHTNRLKYSRNRFLGSFVTINHGLTYNGHSNFDGPL